MSQLVHDVLTIITEKGRVERDRLAMNAKLADLNIASLDVIEIIFALEERFDIQIPFNANAAGNEFGTIGDVVRAVEQATASGGAAQPAA